MSIRSNAKKKIQLAVGPPSSIFISSPIPVPQTPSGTLVKFHIKLYHLALLSSILCIQFQTDHKTAVYPPHNILVQMAYLILQPFLVYRAKLL